MTNATSKTAEGVAYMMSSPELFKFMAKTVCEEANLKQFRFSLAGWRFSPLIYDLATDSINIEIENRLHQLPELALDYWREGELK